MDIEKFVKDNKMVVKAFTGSEDYEPEVIELKYDKKIGIDENIEVFYQIIINAKYRRILLVAPTASGKTYIANELMKRLTAAGANCGISCPSKIQNEQNAKKGEKGYNMQKVVAGDALDETDLDEALRLSLVYDKAMTVIDELARRAHHGAPAPVFFIDEAHTLTEGVLFRKNAIEAVNSLVEVVTEEHNGTIIFITATPAQLANVKFDVIVNCTTQNYVPMARKLTIFETDASENFHKTLLEQTIKLVKNGKIPFIRLNSKPMIVALQNELAVEGIISEAVTGDDKTYTFNPATGENDFDNIIYEHVVKNSQLPRYTADKKRVQVYLCTSVLECGTNILGISGKEDLSLVPFFVTANSKNASPDACEQFYNRVRYQVSDCYMLIANENYNDMVDGVIEKLKSIENVTIKRNDSNSFFEICTTNNDAYRSICAICNKNDILFTIVNANEDKNEYQINISKKSFIELEKVLADHIKKNKNNFKDLNDIYNGKKNLYGVDSANFDIDKELKKPTLTGQTNSQGIVMRVKDNLVINSCALWKSAHDQYCKQYFFLKDIFYTELSNRLGITNISVQKAESIDLNMKAIKEEVKKQTIEILKKEIETNEDLLTEILENKAIAGIKKIVKTEEFKSFVKFVKINHDIDYAFNTIRDSKKSESDKLYAELLKGRLRKLTPTEKTYLEKLTAMDELDFAKIVKNEDSLEIIKIITESGFWKLFVDAVSSGISVDLIIKQMTKEEKDSDGNITYVASKEDVKVYIDKTNIVNLLKSVNNDYTKLGNTIIEKEVKIAMRMFVSINKSGNLTQVKITENHLVKLANALNTGLKRCSNTFYTKKHAKMLLEKVFKIRETTKDDDAVEIAIIAIAKAAK